MANKMIIKSLYDDNKKLIGNNTYLQSDMTFEWLYSRSWFYDWAIVEEFPDRELLPRYLKEDSDGNLIYDWDRIQIAVYSKLTEYKWKYDAIDETIANAKYTHGEISYREEYTRGENEQLREYGSRVNTNTYGDIDTTHNVGATSQTTQNGARENTTSVTSFSSNTFNPSNKTNGAQSTDTTNFASQSNTEKIEHGNDTQTQGSHVDKITNDETTDTKEGVRDLIDNYKKYREFFNVSLYKTVITDVVNAITYNLYL